MINYGNSMTYKYSMRRVFFNIFFILLFSFQQIAIFAQDASLIAITPVSHFSPLPLLDEISFSSEYGIISELHKSQKENDKVIIHIQDAHCNYEAQKNIYHILNKLVKDYKIDLIAQEGGEDYLNIDQFKYPSISRAETQKITDGYLKKGILTASETLLIDNIRSLDFKIFGVENKNEYLRNYKAFLSTIGEKEETTLFFKEVYKLLKRIKKRSFNNKLINFENRKSEIIDSKQLNLKKQIDFLNEQLKLVNQNILKKENVPNFERFNKIRTIEKKINYDLVEEEHETFYKHAKEILNDNAYKLFLNLYLQFKTSKISSYQYYKSVSNYLSGSGLTKSIIDRYQNFFKYAEIQKNYKEIYVGDLIDEINAIERQLRLSFCVTKHQKQLIQIERKIDILNKILNLQATNSEVSYFFNNSKGLNIRKIVKWFKRESQKEGLNFPYALKNDLFPVNQALQKAGDFYQEALNRDHILINNLLHEMNVTNKKVAVLITGGFHTKGITDIIRQKQTSYAVISPAIKSEFASDLYYQLMNKQQVNNHSALFSLPTHLAPVMLLDFVIFPKENNESLNKLKMVLGVFDEDFTEEVVNNLSITTNSVKLEKLLVLVENVMDEISNQDEQTKEALLELKNILQERYDNLIANKLKDFFNANSLEDTIYSESTSNKKGSERVQNQDINSNKRDEVHVYEYQPSATQQDWKASDIKGLFNTFFSDETSPYTTSSAKTTYLRDMLDIIYVDPDGPPPPDPEASRFEEDIFNIKESILTSNALQLLQQKFPQLQKPLEYEIAADFYRALYLKESEEVMLSIIRRLLGAARRLRMEELIQNTDITSVDSFKKLLEKLTLEILDKEKDSLRDLNWRDDTTNNREQYIKNIETVMKTFEVIPENLYDSAIGTFAFRFDDRENSANVKLRFDPRMLKYLAHLKNNRFTGRFQDNKYFEFSPLSGVIILGLLHEWRGHFKHVSSNEPLAVTEEGSRYWVLNYAANLLHLSLIKNRLPNNKELDYNDKNLIIQTARIIFKEHREQGYMFDNIKEFEENIFEVLDFILETIVKTRGNSSTVLTTVMKDIHPVNLTNQGYYISLYKTSEGLEKLPDIRTAVFDANALGDLPIRQSTIEEQYTKIIFQNISKNRDIQDLLRKNNNLKIDSFIDIGKSIVRLNEAIKNQQDPSSLLHNLTTSELISLFKLLHNSDYQAVFDLMPEEIDTSSLKNLILVKEKSKNFTKSLLELISEKLRVSIKDNLYIDLDISDENLISNLKTNLSSTENITIDWKPYLQNNPSQTSNIIFTLTALVAEGLSLNDHSIIEIISSIEAIKPVENKQTVQSREKQASLEIITFFDSSSNDLKEITSMDKESYRKIQSISEKSNISNMNDFVQGGASIIQLNEKLKSGGNNKFLSMLKLNEIVIIFKLINNNNFKDVLDLLGNEFDITNIKQLLHIKEDKNNLSQELIASIVQKVSDTLQDDMDLELKLNQEELAVLIKKNLSSSINKDIDYVDVLENHAGMLEKLRNVASFLSYNDFSFADNSIISILNSIKSAESAKKEQKKEQVSLEVMLEILGIEKQQIGEIITFFDYIFDEERKEFISDSESDKIISLLFQTIFAHHKYLYGGITKNEKIAMISPALIESITTTYNLKDASDIMKLKSLSQSAFTSLELDSLGNFKFLAESLLLQSQLFNQLAGTTYQENSLARFELKEDNLKLELGDRVIYIDKDKLDVEQIEIWNALVFKMATTPHLVASFVYLVSQLIIDEPVTKMLSHIFNEVIPDPNETVDRIINIIIDPDDSVETKEAQALLIKTLQDAGKDSKLICVGDAKIINEFQKEYQLTKELNISDKPDNNNGAIVIGSGALFNEFKNDKRKGLFFLDSVNSPSGAILMSIAFAFQNSKIIDNLKISANEQDQKKIEGIWQVLLDFTEDSETQDSIMPNVVPLLKNLLKYLNNEELTIMVAA